MIISVSMYKSVFLLCLLTAPAIAIDNGQYENVDPVIRDWFRGVKSPNGVPCCNIADGHSTIWRKSETIGHEFDVPIEGEWTPVPNEAIVYNAKNPTGESIVWYVRQYDGGPDKWHIRCFVLGSGA